MTHEVVDRTGELLTVGIEHSGPINAYVVQAPKGAPVGRVDYVEPPGPSEERIVFHTEVDPDFGGRGIASMLVSEVLTDSIGDGMTIVPVCPLFARHLKKHGDEFVASGGAFRTPRPADFDLIGRLTRARA